jgi:hypothetical protein
MNHNGGGFAAADLPGERRAGYGAAPPASRVATAIAARWALRPALDPAASTAPHRAVAGAGAKPLPAGPHGAHDQAQQNKVSTVSGDCHRTLER